MIVRVYGSCAAGCNQEPVQAIVAQVVSQYIVIVVNDDGSPNGPVGSGA